MAVYNAIVGLVEKGVEKHLIDKQDVVYTKNQVLALLKLDSFPNSHIEATEESIPNLLEELIDYATNDAVIENTLDSKEILQAKIMNCFLPHPSIVNQNFWQLYKESPMKATDYFYHLSINSNYIQMKRINKNIHFKADSIYGEIEITINLSKPEKDPEQIKREKDLKQNLDYPKCVLCIENEGYAGRTAYPARSNHRMVNIPIGQENWFLQYSPYIYYNEHSILLHETHQPMEINKKTFQDLVSFVEQFPHYFIGSNADLPIVGGSILNHNHYQAGHKEFPMTKAVDEFHFSLSLFPNVAASVLKWPMSVIRLKSTHKQDIIEAANHIFTYWQTYEDDEAAIIPYTNQTPHNTVTPIARYEKGVFELDIVLRNNRTSDEHPLGIFHPHQDVQHIKKENIGLIEVMGLAVLPGRLIDELAEIEQALIQPQLQVASIHKEWLNELRRKYDNVHSLESSKQIVKKELGNIFMRVLEDASVYKQTTEGKTALQRFINKLNGTE